MYGCGSSGGNDRPNESASAPVPVSSQGRQQAVRLSGCVELSGTALAQYVLQRVHVEDREGQDPQRTTSNPEGGIVEGSWVRLSGARNLRALAGHRVEVRGVLIDPGRTAVGTTDESGVILPSGDVSRAATDEVYWVKVRKEAGPIARTSIEVGTAPEIKVTEIKDLGEPCHEAKNDR
jgi:hypothetical protein